MKMQKQLWRLRGWRVGAGVLSFCTMLGGQMMWGPAAASQAPIVFSDDVWGIVPSAYVDSRDYLIAEPAMLSVALGAHATFSGKVANMAGSHEGLVKLGAGVLTLSGHNTYRGPTHVLQGELRVAGNQATGTGSVHANTGSVLSYAPGVTVSHNLQFSNVAMADQPLPPEYRTELPGKADTVRWHVDSGQATHAGVLAGSAGFEKTGAGRLSLDYDALAYTGNAVVREGTLAVNELFSGAVQVQSGARLEGVGSIASVWVRDGGTLAPGASIGVLRIPGDLRFDTGSTLALEVAADGRHDTLVVGGAAVLAGDVQALADAGDWQPATHYRFLTAAGGLGGTRFEGVSSNFAFLSPSLTYDDTSVTLTLARNDTPLTTPATTPDETEVATVIDTDAPATGTPGLKDLPQLYDAIVVLDRDGARDAYRQLGGAWAASVRATLLDDSRFVREAVFDSRDAVAQAHVGEQARQIGARQESRSVSAQPTRKGWGHTYGAHGRGKAAASAPAYARTLRGFTLGSRHLVRHMLEVGGFVGAQQRHLSQRSGSGASSSRLDSFHVGLNAGWSADDYRIDTGVAVEWHHIQTERRVQLGRVGQVLHSAYRSRTAQWFGQWALSRGALMPFAQLALVHNHTPSYAESGGQAALKYAAANDLALYTTLGVKTFKAFTTALGAGRFNAELAWQHVRGDRQLASRHAFGDGQAGTRFASHGQGVPANALKARITVSTELGRKGYVHVGYTGLLAPGRIDHGLMLQVQHRF